MLMRSIRRFAFVSTLFTYLVIFTGGLVRVSGAGLGCPDWPRCFGRWIPPLSYSQLPPQFDPDQVNLVLAWIEYTNRLLGMTLGILIVITAVLAIVHFRKVAKILLPSLAAGILVAILGWQGGQVVESHLEPMAVSLHLFIALLLVSLMTYVTQQSYYQEFPQADRGEYPRGTRGWVGLLWILAIIQVVLGALLRGGLELAARDYPLDANAELLARVGSLIFIHPLLGAVVVLTTWVVGFRLLAVSRAVGLVRQGIWWAMLLMLAQLLIGLGLLAIGTPPLLQVFHLWIAALFIGDLLLVFTAVRRHDVISGGTPSPTGAG
jgi:cytochrome c oxidase assembly protein subunit 15